MHKKKHYSGDYDLGMGADPIMSGSKKAKSGNILGKGYGNATSKGLIQKGQKDAHSAKIDMDIPMFDFGNMGMGKGKKGFSF